ncbi:MAG: type I DNA topoisomerase [Chloroflexota bacterium]
MTDKSNGHKLVVVESPAKARTISRILKGGYTIKASLGHVRDLPEKRLGIDIEHGFTPQYVVPYGKKKVVEGIRKASESASAIYLATDPDREGEAISWHLLQATRIERKPIHRVVFHEITPDAVTEAFKHPRGIDMNLVDAQQTRRVLDRLVGYKLSPLLWRKVQKGLSAGRVQSAAVKMIVDREREIRSFKPTEFWTIDAELMKAARPDGVFRARFIGPKGGEKLAIANEAEANRLKNQLNLAAYSVASIQTKDMLRNPAPPFTTSTLQQEAWRKLRFTTERTMAIAQQLYEGVNLGHEGSTGLITYMRTDSTHIAESALAETRAFIKEKYGAPYLPPHGRVFGRKGKFTQEAHEAIRPTKIYREPDRVKPYLDSSQLKLYELIWKRMVASQMAATRLENTTVDVDAMAKEPNITYLFRTTVSQMKFPGFMTLYVEGRDETEPETSASTLPTLSAGEPLVLIALFPQQNFTEPPPRYTEATLVKAMEQKGIGRPSTYAATISTVQKREYVHKEQGRFFADKLGMVVTDLLAEHFPQVVDLDFTARVESKLDEIARGELKWVPSIRSFWDKFQERLEKAHTNIQKQTLVEETNEVCPNCSKPMVVKVGKFGRFLACTGYPECKTTKPFLATIGVNCPECGKPLVLRRSKQKKTVFYGCSGYPDCKFLTRNRPLPQPCPKCGGFMVAWGKSGTKCTKCSYRGKTSESEVEAIAV